ncbi:MAG: S8 family serine peptidase [Nitrososphaerota archaeon]
MGSRRVVRKIGDEFSETSRKAGALTLVATLLTVWLVVNSLINPSPPLVGGEVVYVVNPKTLDKCVETWLFGDTVICKTYEGYVPGSRTWKIKTVSIPVIGYEPSASSQKTVFDLHGKSSFTGSGVVVAVIDTGIDYTHPMLKDAVVEIWSVLYKTSTGGFLHWIVGVNGTLYDMALIDHYLKESNGEYAFADEAGHGTHVSGLIAGRPYNGFIGYAPNAMLFVVKAFLKNGTASVDMVLNALRIVYDNVERLKIRVVNLSWGALLNSDGSDPISVAAAKIAEKDVLVFAAAGNEGNIPFRILSPAVHRNVIALGAIESETGRIASFSSWGTTVDLRMKPDFVAAGVGIVSARSSFSKLTPWRGDSYLASASGTSISTAVASGIGALYAEYWSAMGGRESLRESFLRFQEHMAERINQYYKDFISGLGILTAP